MSYSPVWSSWRDVPQDPQEVRRHGTWFLEIFSGSARLTEQVKLLRMPILPPVDIECSPWVPVPQDALDAAFWDRLMSLALIGALFFVHFGTPCNTFTSARKLDGGPRPLRSATQPMGLDDLSPENQALVFLGNCFLFRTVELALAVFDAGGDFSIENPLLSLLWLTPTMGSLQLRARTMDVDLDQCMFGAPSMKPTRLRVSHAAFLALQCSCNGSHTHERLKGKVWDPKRKKIVFRTKLAQEYPFVLCAAMAMAVQTIRNNPLQQFSESFTLTALDRKRKLGTPVTWTGHRQEQTAAKALQAGYQLKRGALKPLLELELEPGQAIQWALEVVHPFTVPSPLEDMITAPIAALAAGPMQVQEARVRTLEFWESEAHRLLPESLRRIAKQPDPALRRLLRGAPDDQPATLGQVCHVALYEAMLHACGSVDTELPLDLLTGFPIVGPIAQSHRWPAYTKPQPALPVQQALDKAWDLRKKIVRRVETVPVSDNLRKIWEATLEDCEEGSCIGPWFSEEEVSRQLGCEDWIPTQRFEVVQKNKVRGCDSATTNMINQVTVISEKLQLPSTDTNVAAIRTLRSAMPLDKLAGWVLDERKAYRQIAVRPDQRKFSVICLKDPSSGKPAFFIMIGHSFGLVSAVYNYNRRSAAINEFLCKLFNLVAFNFYDDKYGFEPVGTVKSARLAAECVHLWLGAKFDQKKLQLSSAPTILGVTYNLDSMQLEIKDDRKSELTEEIVSILKSDQLDPGTAGKIKGKLMFGASQLWGKIGRAFLRVISERQYSRFPTGPSFSLDKPLRVALGHWLSLIKDGPPRTIDRQVSKRADAVIFTDGFTPDPRIRAQQKELDRVGAVLFDRRLDHPLQFTEIVPDHVSQKWLHRATQIIPIEMVAPILALCAFRERLFNADVIRLIDSEVVEAALVKGYSSKADVCELISVFWDLALELRCRLFIDRVSTDANPADWPSRNDLDRGASVGWVTVQAKWPESLSR